MYQGRVTIDSLISEHVAIRGHMEYLRGLTREWERLLTSKGPIKNGGEQDKALTDKLANLRQAMGYLEDGLRNHHSHEATIMPPLVGDLLWKAIWLEHSEMLKMTNEIKSLVLNASLEAFLDKGTYTMQKIEDLRSFASTHSIREDGILLFLKKLPELK